MLRKRHLPPIPPPIKVPRAIRNIREPTCSDFGPNRNTIWPGLFICNTYSLYDKEIAFGKKELIETLVSTNVRQVTLIPILLQH